MAKVLEAPVSSGLDVRVHTAPGGESEAVTTISWTLSKELVNEIEERKFTNPHLLIVVGYMKTEKWGNKSHSYFHPTKVYTSALTDTPKRYISLSHPGENIITATIVDIQDSQDADRVRRWKSNAANIDVSPEAVIDTYYLRALEGATSVRKVSVDAGFFAKEPPKWLQNLVDKFYETGKFDQCHFRGRAIVSGLATIPIQIYGVFVRFFTLLFVVFRASRGVTLRNFLAYNPHDFGRSLGESAWEVDKNGHERKVLPWFSPTFIAVYIGSLMLASLPAGFYLTIKTSIVYGKHYNEYFARISVGEWILTGLVLDAIIALIIFLLWLLSYDGRSFLRRIFLKRSRKVAHQSPEPDPTIYDKILAQSQVAAKENIPNNNVHLVFNNVKSWVCKPFAQ